MPSKEQTIFRTSDGETLTGAIYEPSTRNEGVIGLFTPGWSAKYEDYESILLPLAESYRVLAFNLRGHGGSSGVIDSERCIEDLCEIQTAYGEPRTAFLGHSLASFTLAAAERCDPQALILFNPYVNSRLLEPKLRGIISILNNRPFDTIARAADGILQQLPLQKLGLMNMERPFANAIPIAGFDITHYQTIDHPLLYFVADHDAILGTVNQEQYRQIRAALAQASTNPDDASDLVVGLNHCLNRKGLVPFFKEEDGKNRDRILARIFEFLEQHLVPEKAEPLDL